MVEGIRCSRLNRSVVERVMMVLCPGFLFLLSLSLSVHHAGAQARTGSVDTIFGTIVRDPFRYMEDPGDPRTIQFKESQKNVVAGQQKTLGYTKPLYNRLLERHAIAYRPLIRQGKYYFISEADEKSAPVLYYRDKFNGLDKLAFAPREFSTGPGDIASIQGFSLSRDNRYLAVSLSHSGSDWREIRVKDLESQKVLSDQVNWVRFSDVEWWGDGFFYCRYDETSSKFPEQVSDRKLYYHKLGTPQREDQFIFATTAKGSAFFDFEVSSDMTTLFVYTPAVVRGKVFNSIQFRMLAGESKDFKSLILWPSDSKVGYSIVHKTGDRVLALSNLEGFNRSIVELTMGKPNEVAPLVPLVKERLVSANVFGEKLVCVYRKNSDEAFAVYSLDGKLLTSWGIQQGYSISSISGNVDDAKFVYGFENFTGPASFYEADLESFKRRPLSKTAITYDVFDLVTEYVEYPSADGTMIPMYLSYNKRVPKDRIKGCLLTAYGGFGISYTPSFNPMYQLLFENDFMLAVPCVRGGGEKENWHEAGKRQNKQRSIEDFVAAASFLRSNGYAPKIVAYGSSNGGLLVASAMIRRPELFDCVVPEVGVFDMVRYQYFTGGYLWSEEYGLSSDSVDFVNLISYSPVHTIQEYQKYPPTLVITSDHDDRVPPLHSYKFAALLRNSTDGGRHCLYVETQAGHTGSAIINTELEKEAFTLAFIFHHLGIKRPILK